REVQSHHMGLDDVGYIGIQFFSGVDDDITVKGGLERKDSSPTVQTLYKCFAMALTYALTTTWPTEAWVIWHCGEKWRTSIKHDTLTRYHESMTRLRLPSQ
ncbi:hypothetical protein ACFOYZ_30055, partial [Neobacillus cucumis]|uniref:hypothetical protein n=1 Tax=Neobacillus cucumis TaxID=1740721 RepID=UPI00361B80FE